MNNEPDYAALVEDAIETEATVTVTRADGKVVTGKLSPHPTEPDFVKVVTGKRGRPFTFHPEDLDDIEWE